MIGQGMLWAMLGPRSMVVIAVVTLVLYGRSGVLRTRGARTAWSWLSPVRRTPGPAAPTSGRTIRGDRTFWFLTILAAAALTAWIVTRTLIVTAPGVSH
jgi:hypothetical protein